MGRIRTPQFRTAAPRTPPGRRSVHGGLRSYSILQVYMPVVINAAFLLTQNFANS